MRLTTSPPPSDRPSASARPRKRVLGLATLFSFAVMLACDPKKEDDPPPVIPPTPTIALASSGSVTGAQGTTQTATITLTRGGSYTGDVALSAVGLPTGVTATFTPATLGGTTTASTVTLTIGANATVGSATITVSGSGAGVTSASAQIPLTVTAVSTPDYSISASPATITLAPGQSGPVTVNVTRVNGFTSSVALTVSGLPAGVTAAVGTQPGTGNSGTLTVTAGGSAAAGTYTGTVTANASGVSTKTTTFTLVITAAPGLTATLTPSTLSIARGANATSTVTITRVGGLTGDVALTAEAISNSGITVAFAPSTITSANTTSTATVTVGAAVPAGSYSATVRATGTGSVATTASLTITVTEAQGYTLSTAPSSLSIAPGAASSTTVAIARTGGFAGGVTLAIAGFPTGITATTTPNPTTANSATLSVSVGASVTAGTYTGTITGAAAGLSAQTTPLSVTVTGGGGGGGGNISWRFCDADRIPLWFAFRNGTSGAWTRVTAGANNTYSFTVSSVGGVAYAIPTSAGSQPSVTIGLYSAAELSAQAAAECVQNPATKSLTGTVANVPLLQSANISVGGGAATVTGPLTTYTLSGVNLGLTDLVANRYTFDLATFSNTPDRFILRRGVDYAANSAIPLLDFTGSESFAPVTATYTLANKGSETVFITTSFNTANGSSSFGTVGSLSNTGTTATVYGIPLARTVAGDFHGVFASVSTADASSSRIMLQYNREITNRTLTFGAPLSTPTVTVQGTSPFARLKSRGTWQAEYGEVYTFSCNQTVGAVTRSWIMTATKGYAGSPSEYELEYPDFSGVAGFSNVWGFVTGTVVNCQTSGTGVTVGAISAVIEGGGFKNATRSSAITP